jgi:hypothetical protein
MMSEPVRFYTVASKMIENIIPEFRKKIFFPAVFGKQICSPLLSMKSAITDSHATVSFHLI